MKHYIAQVTVKNANKSFATKWQAGLVSIADSLNVSWLWLPSIH